MDLPTKEFVFVRHGETEWNLHKKFQGQTDIPLNPTGREQAHGIRPLVESMDIDHIYSSPLSRARETAEILNSSMGVPLELEPRLMECASESTARHIYTDIRLDRFPSFGYVQVQIDECPREFSQRCQDALSSILDRGHQCPAIIAHGGTLWALCKALNIPTFQAPNCSPLHVFTEDFTSWSLTEIKK